MKIYPQKSNYENISSKVIMKIYRQKHIHTWTGIQLTNEKNNKINMKSLI
jgi:hypothetical protein